ncbi:MAG TPA: acyltransferase, partial [Pseudonocardiaceae bacterium]|nr:acyltransferase [Pseudonocardiaceae bacterium]
MSAWPELRQARTVRAGRAPGTVVRCGLMDTMLADIPVSVVFVYASAPDEDRMADGLARALAQLPVFAGRLRETPDSLEIVCDDSGVPMMSYELDGTLAATIGRLALPGSDYVDHVPAPATRAGELPLLTVRITRLSDGGMVMGCSWHHAVGDMQTFMLLMRTWSACVEGTPLPDTYVIQDMDTFLEDRLPTEDSGRPGFRLPSPEDAVEVNRELENAVRANRIVQAYFSDDEVSRIRAEITAAARQRLSTNDVLCGHLVSTIRRLDDDPEGRWLAIPINIRRYLG